MTKKSLRKKITALVSILALSASLAACGKPKPVAPPKDEKAKVEDKAMTEKITKEDIVSGSKVYIKGKTITATMIIKKGVKQENITKIANQYAQELKKQYKNLQEEYKGMTINVQAVQGGKNVANILIEK
ncbi:hypothetical protein [Clostridium ganghwense]|uniref:Lipoprotein n=1 Tax=Clostridium ganghwense TaxID=312089 RepID=A0ABT4CPV7_9CLOT|nr:hypothetical protein [Clostridium ganghwense]MCY6370983.1 hypothetical protein [Clostridium ganghwense]